MLRSAQEAVLIVIDIQSRLMPAMETAAGLAVEVNTGKLLQAAEVHGVPVVVSEQVPDKLGPTIAPVAERFPEGLSPHAKEHFSLWRDEGCRKAVAATGRAQAILAGVESHVCVLQSALDLAEAGYHVLVVEDAVASRFEVDRQRALSLLVQSGVGVVTTEMLIFRWLERATHEHFRAMSKLVRERPELAGAAE